MKEWLEQQRKLVAWLEAHLKELPEGKKAGQQAVIKVMKKDIRRVEAAVKPSEIISRHHLISSKKSFTELEIE